MDTPPARLIGLLLAAHLGLAQAAPWATPHSVRAGPYLLRASTVYSLAIPQQVAAANGVRRDARHGVLNVMVARNRAGTQENLRAGVHAVIRDLTGKRRAVPLREIVANGQVSYLGTYDFVAGEVVDFIVDAVPAGTDRKLELRFRDRLWPRQ